MKFLDLVAAAFRTPKAPGPRPDLPRLCAELEGLAPGEFMEVTAVEFDALRAITPEQRRRYAQTAPTDRIERKS